MADSGEDDLGRLAQAGGVAHQRVAGADLVQCVLHGAQVTGAVIENGDHNSPFVEGNWPRRRLSVEQAYFIARAKHLKMASILWWFERPYRDLGVEVGAGMVDEAAEEILHQFGLQIAHQPHAHQILVHQRGPAAEIERHHGQRFIHGQHEIAGAIDAAPVAQRFGEQLAQHDAHVFDGVVLIDVEVAIGIELEIEAAVFGEQFEHVVEEADAGRDFVAAAAFDGTACRESGFPWCCAGWLADLMRITTASS